MDLFKDNFGPGFRILEQFLEASDRDSQKTTRILNFPLSFFRKEPPITPFFTFSLPSPRYPDKIQYKRKPKNNVFRSIKETAEMQAARTACLGGVNHDKEEPLIFQCSDTSLHLLLSGYGDLPCGKQRKKNLNHKKRIRKKSQPHILSTGSPKDKLTIFTLTEHESDNCEMERNNDSLTTSTSTSSTREFYLPAETGSAGTFRVADALKEKCKIQNSQMSVKSSIGNSNENCFKYSNTRDNESAQPPSLSNYEFSRSEYNLPKLVKNRAREQSNTTDNVAVSSYQKPNEEANTNNQLSFLVRSNDVPIPLVTLDKLYDDVFMRLNVDKINQDSSQFLRSGVRQEEVNNRRPRKTFPIKADGATNHQNVNRGLPNIKMPKPSDWVREMRAYKFVLEQDIIENESLNGISDSNSSSNLKDKNKNNTTLTKRNNEDVFASHKSEELNEKKITNEDFDSENMRKTLFSEASDTDTKSIDTDRKREAKLSFKETKNQKKLNGHSVTTGVKLLSSGSVLSFQNIREKKVKNIDNESCKFKKLNGFFDLSSQKPLITKLLISSDLIAEGSGSDSEEEGVAKIHKKRKQPRPFQTRVSAEEISSVEHGEEIYQPSTQRKSTYFHDKLRAPVPKKIKEVKYDKNNRNNPEDAYVYNESILADEYNFQKLREKFDLKKTLSNKSKVYTAQVSSNTEEPQENIIGNSIVIINPPLKKQTGNEKFDKIMTEKANKNNIVPDNDQMHKNVQVNGHSVKSVEQDNDLHDRTTHNISSTGQDNDVLDWNMPENGNQINKRVEYIGSIAENNSQTDKAVQSDAKDKSSIETDKELMKEENDWRNIAEKEIQLDDESQNANEANNKEVYKARHGRVVTKSGFPALLYNESGFPFTDFKGRLLKNNLGLQLLDVKSYQEVIARSLPVYDANNIYVNEAGFDPSTKPNVSTLVKITDKVGNPVSLYNNLGLPLTDEDGLLLHNSNGEILVSLDSKFFPLCCKNGTSIYLRNGSTWLSQRYRYIVTTQNKVDNFEKQKQNQIKFLNDNGTSKKNLTKVDCFTCGSLTNTSVNSPNFLNKSTNEMKAVSTQHNGSPELILPYKIKKLKATENKLLSEQLLLQQEGNKRQNSNVLGFILTLLYKKLAYKKMQELKSRKETELSRNNISRSNIPLFDVEGNCLTDEYGYPLCNRYGEPLLLYDKSGWAISDSYGGPIFNSKGQQIVISGQNRAYRSNKSHFVPERHELPERPYCEQMEQSENFLGNETAEPVRPDQFENSLSSCRRSEPLLKIIERNDIRAWNIHNEVPSSVKSVYSLPGKSLDTHYSRNKPHHNYFHPEGQEASKFFPEYYPQHAHQGSGPYESSQQPYLVENSANPVYEEYQSDADNTEDYVDTEAYIQDNYRKYHHANENSHPTLYRTVTYPYNEEEYLYYDQF